TCETRHLGQAARGQCGQRVVPEPEAFDDTGGDRDNVFERATDLHANHIIGSVQAEVRRAEFSLHALYNLWIPRSNRDGGWQLASQLDRKAGPRQHGDACSRSALLLHDLGHPKQRVALEAFRRADDRRATTDMRRSLAKHLSRAMRGHGGDHEIAAVERVAKIGSHADVGREADLGQGDRDVTAFVDVRRQRGITRPEMRLVTDAREVHRERRSPPPGAEYRDVTNDESPIAPTQTL